MRLRLLAKLVGCTGSKSLSRTEVACLADDLDVGGEEEEQNNPAGRLCEQLDHFLGGEAVRAMLL